MYIYRHSHAFVLSAWLAWLSVSLCVEYVPVYLYSIGMYESLRTWHPISPHKIAGLGCKASRGRTQCVGSSALAMKEGMGTRDFGRVLGWEFARFWVLCRCRMPRIVVMWSVKSHYQQNKYWCVAVSFKVNNIYTAKMDGDPFVISM